MKHMLSKMRAFLRASGGVAAVEFGIVVPTLTVAFVYGAELFNLSYANMRISEMATIAVDDASRVRSSITEDNIAELFTGAKLAGQSLSFAENGRIILSSIQSIPDNAPTPGVKEFKIRWQRCTGANAANSSYGLEGNTVPLPGIGPVSRKAGPRLNSEMIFVEIVYQYQPLISEAFLGPQTIRTTAAMIVRERTANNINAGTTTAKVCTGAHVA